MVASWSNCSDTRIFHLAEGKLAGTEGVVMTYRSIYLQWTPNGEVGRGVHAGRKTNTDWLKGLPNTAIETSLEIGQKVKLQQFN